LSSCEAALTLCCRGAQAVNAYVADSRWTEDVDIASPRAAELAEELCAFLRQRFGIAVCVRDLKEGARYRVEQVRQPRNRHLVDVRLVVAMPPGRRVRKVLVATPPDLIGDKVISMVGRLNRPKGLQDQTDLYRLLLTFPELKKEEGLVCDRLRAAEAGDDVMAAWKELVAQDIREEEDHEEFL
jgi:hypothetical protein